MIVRGRPATGRCLVGAAQGSVCRRPVPLVREQRLCNTASLHTAAADLRHGSLWPARPACQPAHRPGMAKLLAQGPQSSLPGLDLYALVAVSLAFQVQQWCTLQLWLPCCPLALTQTAAAAGVHIRAPLLLAAPAKSPPAHCWHLPAAHLHSRCQLVLHLLPACSWQSSEPFYGLACQPRGLPRTLSDQPRLSTGQSAGTLPTCAWGASGKAWPQVCTREHRPAVMPCALATMPHTEGQCRSAGDVQAHSACLPHRSAPDQRAA